MQKLNDCSQPQNFVQQTLHEIQFFNDEIVAHIKLSVDKRLQNQRHGMADILDLQGQF